MGSSRKLAFDVGVDSSHLAMIEDKTAEAECSHAPNQRIPNRNTGNTSIDPYL